LGIRGEEEGAARRVGRKGLRFKGSQTFPTHFIVRPRPADAKQATVVLSACVWYLCEKERKTGSERAGVRERGRVVV